MTKISATVMGAVLSVLAGGTRGDAGAWGLSQDAANKGMATRQKHRTTPTFQTLTCMESLCTHYTQSTSRGEWSFRR